MPLAGVVCKYNKVMQDSKVPTLGTGEAKISLLARAFSMKWAQLEASSHLPLLLA